MAPFSAHPYRDPVRSFVETAVVACGFSDLPALERAELAEALLVEAYKRVGMELYGLLDGSSLAAFERLMDEEADDDELEAFFSVRVPDADRRVRSVLESFQEECLRAAEETGAAV